MCGVTGVIGIEDASSVISILLHALQNRGQDGCGIATIEGPEQITLHVKKWKGSVSGNINERVLAKLPGNEGIGHTRYATVANSGSKANLQPFFFYVGGVPFTFAHNGNLTNTDALSQDELRGIPFNSVSDTERLLRLILLEHGQGHPLAQSIVRAVSKIQGSCSAVLHTPGKLFAIRDASGNRPLFWGKKDDGYVVASETCALDAIDIFDWQEVPPGTVMCFSADKVETHRLPRLPLKMCTFELLYFGFPTSVLFGVPVGKFRYALGRRMAELHPIDADLVVGVPDSAIEMASGFSDQLRNRPVSQGVMVRRHNTGRTFILPDQAARIAAVSRKFSFATHRIAGKRIVLIDDSVVRGTTSCGITDALRARGAKEVHWRIPSPQIIAACHYGINTAHRSRLLAAENPVEEMRRYIGADSLEFLTVPDFQRVIKENGLPSEHGCYACMTGEYWHST